MLLVFEINNLRRELKITRDRAQAYEMCLGILPSNFNNSKTMEMKVRLQTAIRDKEAVSLLHDRELQVSQESNTFSSHHKGRRRQLILVTF